jgi:crotonobetainyl-CoA:carnitine CoA-transferase CaiB-like acyl-CoA transferase
MILSGFRLVELATHIAGPGAAGILADWGAEVIKIEAPGGDPIRRLRPGPGHSSPVFEQDNRGKRSVVIDYRHADGLTVLRRLIGRADAFVTSLRPASMARANLDWATLHADYPSLVYASVTGYGLEGPDADKSAFDSTAFWCQSGLSDTMRPQGVEPHRWRAGFGDHVCAVATALGIVTALLNRTRTGRGSLVETSLLKAAIYAAAGDMADQLRTGHVAPTQLRGSPGAPPSNAYRTSDGLWISAHPVDPAQSWAEVFQAAGRPDLAADPRFITAKGRNAHARELERLLDDGFGAATGAEIGARLDRTSLVWSPIRTIAEAADDPATVAAGCFTLTDDGAGGAFRAPAPPVRFPEEQEQTKGAVPRVGEHADAVLVEAGYSLDEIARLRAKGAIS